MGFSEKVPQIIQLQYKQPAYKVSLSGWSYTVFVMSNVFFKFYF